MLPVADRYTRLAETTTPPDLLPGSNLGPKMGLLLPEFAIDRLRNARDPTTTFTDAEQLSVVSVPFATASTHAP